MKLLVILLLHPTYIIKSRERFPVMFLHLFVLGYVAMCGMAFQYLYPRLLNDVPWLGFLRKLAVTNWNPGFDPDLFFPGCAMGAIVFSAYFLIYGIADMIKPGRGLFTPYLAAMATCMPVFITCALAFGFYYVHDSLGLIPAYGMAVSSCLHVIILKDLYRVPRSVSIYLAPLILSGQMYACYLLLP